MITCVLLPAGRLGIPGVCHSFSHFPWWREPEMSTSFRPLVDHKNILWNIWFKPFWCGNTLGHTFKLKNANFSSAHIYPQICPEGVLNHRITCSRNTWPRERNGKKEILSWFDQESMVWEGRWKIQRMCQTILVEGAYKPFGLEDKGRWWYWTFMTNQFYGFWFSDRWPLSLDDVNISLQ